jgi:hypothetical protein
MVNLTVMGQIDIKKLPNRSHIKVVMAHTPVPLLSLCYPFSKYAFPGCVIVWSMYHSALAIGYAYHSASGMSLTHHDISIHPSIRCMVVVFIIVLLKLL